ncbi:hypothetical protein I6U51_22230 [Clostridium aciditolerans]|uniref:Uncharacterized protein n=1 Tax=Clostridium aciditolerans TaxID=339861 RepID=A0A934I223_9CLOT|nr:hypothetical protein [Clostridium aciditolerans]
MEKKKLKNINSLIGNARSTEHILFLYFFLYANFFIPELLLDEANQRISVV